MAKRVLWRSWSRLEAGFELERMKSLPMQHEWVNAHQHQPGNGDIYLTTNGYDHKRGPFVSATLYAESYVYLGWEYDRWQKNQNKWHHRFHFNPHYANSPKCTHQGIGTWWKCEMALFEELLKNKRVDHVFGMVLGNKGTKRGKPCDIGWIRAEIVKAGRGRSFKYFGTKWPPGDPNCGGERYIKGHRGTPLKFHDARRLMANAKFVFACENTHDKHYSVNYLTEKIWHGFLSRSVPIYVGCWNVGELIPPNIFIDARKFGLNAKKIMDHCEKMPDSEYNGYLERIEAFLRGPGQKFTCDERFVDLDRKLVGVFG
jgi:hypothetical protein